MWRIHDADSRAPLTKSFMHQPGRVLDRLYQLIGEHRARDGRQLRDFYIADAEGNPIPAKRFATLAKFRTAS